MALRHFTGQQLNVQKVVSFVYYEYSMKIWQEFLGIQHFCMVIASEKNKKNTKNFKLEKFSVLKIFFR